MDRITKEANLEPEALNKLLFADDQSLAHESEEHLHEHTTLHLRGVRYEDQRQQDRDSEGQQDTRST